MRRTPFEARAILSIAAVAFSVLLGACGSSGGSSGPSTNVSGATVGTPSLGQPLLFTFTGESLDQGLSASSPGCNNITLSTTAPNVSTATTAYFTCVPSVVGGQIFTVTRNSDGLQLRSVSYTVPQPPPVVRSGTAGPASLQEPLLFTFTGEYLDQGISGNSPGCSSITLVRTAPNISTATTAYFRCVPSVEGERVFTVTRISDGAQLFTVPYFVTRPLTTITSATAATPKYSQAILFTVNGRGLTDGLDVSASGCTNVALSTTPPNVSGANTAYFTCVASSLGAGRLNLTRRSDSVALTSVAFDVPQPQVTLAISNGAGVNGNLVITLDPAKTPITVNNFLSYVNSGYYAGTIFHRNAPNFVLQGGGFAGPLVANGPFPTEKPTNAPITLEVGKGLSNVKYTVAMARTGNPNSATSQFFINLVDNLFLDTSGGGYAVFGNISTGTEVVTAMAAAPCVPWTAVTAGPGECFPSPNLTIVSATQTR